MDKHRTLSLSKFETQSDQTKSKRSNLSEGLQALANHHDEDRWKWSLCSHVECVLLTEYTQAVHKAFALFTGKRERE